MAAFAAAQSNMSPIPSLAAQLRLESHFLFARIESLMVRFDMQLFSAPGSWHLGETRGGVPDRKDKHEFPWVLLVNQSIE